MDVISLTQALIQRPSVTPDDAGCQVMLAERLSPLGFSIETMVFEDTTNMWARKGSGTPLFCFAGHTDVVPTGSIADWHYPPFSGELQDGFIHGRGAADMKGSLAAMTTATERFVRDYPNHRGSIAFLITSDEEGPFINGTTRVIDTLEARQEKIDYCIVGEPSSTMTVGDVIKNGRRGSLTGFITIKGTQGHVAYPHLADNPIHNAAPALAALSQTVWDQGNEYFPPTSFQISNINGGTGAGNVIPGSLEVQFNFRYSTEVSKDELISRVHQIFTAHRLNYESRWIHNGLPFLTEPGGLLDGVQNAITRVVGKPAQASTAGGTSDGRFIAPTGAEVVELGPINATIHQVNEKVLAEDLIALEQMYYQTLVEMLGC